MIPFFILIIAIVFILRLPVVKGAIGEFIVKTVIGTTVEAPQNPKFIINNLVLETAPGKTSQTDHVVINTNGVFVIETKNYSGRIYGTDAQNNWTQVLKYGKVKNHFYNPVKQNLAHTYKIKELISDKYPVYPLVVFVKGNIRFIKSQNVYSIGGLVRRLKQSTGRQLSFDEMKSVYDILNTQNKSDVISNHEHVQNIKRTQSNIADNVCPRCGGTLIVRHGKNGIFIGCSNYPKCRFTKK